MSQLLMSSGAPPASYLKRVTSCFSKIEPLLKTLQVRPSPPEALIQAYLIHVADLSDANFRKILELKGIRGKVEQQSLTEIFQMHKLSERYKDTLVEKSVLLTPLIISGPSLSAPGVSVNAVSNIQQGLGAIGSTAAASLSTANLPANMKFDPSGLGNALMDRFSNPGTSTPREIAQSPPAVSTLGGDLSATGLSEGKLNENLKNIGKFFRRDIGGFGGRFGRSPAPDDRQQ